MPLRLLTEADLPLVLTWRNAPVVRNSMYSTHVISEAEHRAWFARMKEDPHSRWYIHVNERGQSDGVVYFTEYRPKQSNAFWGFYAGEGAEPGAGTQLGLDGLDEAFDVLKLHKLNAEVISKNERSLRFHEKFGFQKEGIFRNHYFDGTNYIDVVRFGMLASEWAGHRAALIKHVLNSHSDAE